MSADPDDRDQGREEVLGKLRHLFTTGSGPGTDVDAREVLGAFEAEVRAAMEEKSKRSNRVWSELAILVGCTSPDGSAELGQVSYYQERAEAAEAQCEGRIAEADRLRAQVAELTAAALELCAWVRHTVPEWTPEVDRWLEATEAALQPREVKQ
jgi:hypothetical protein